MTYSRILAKVAKHDWKISENFNVLFRFVVIAFDEMKIREDLVSDKTTGVITGFVDYGKQNLDQRFAEECMLHWPLKQRCAASHMFTIMVRGIFFQLNFPFAAYDHLENSENVVANLLVFKWYGLLLMVLPEQKVFKKHWIDG